MWKLEQSRITADYFNAAIRDEMMEGWKNKYYNNASIGKVLGQGGWWGDAEMFEVVLDAYETTGDAAYEEMFRNLYENFTHRNGTNWLGNAFNDDIAWMVLVSVRAYLMFGDSQYLTYGKTNFDSMYGRAAVLPYGMLIWNSNENPRGTNSCINGPAEVAACYLAIATGDESYYEKAKKVYAAQRKYLYVPTTGQVYDSFTWSGDNPTDYNHWASTYNQGTFLGAAVMLYNYYGDEQYKEDAKMIMKYTLEHLCDENEIVKVCQVATGDLAGFKGILMRYVRRFIVDLKQTEYVEWMAKNAFHAYNNRNSAGVSSSAWLTKAPEDFIFVDCTNDCSFDQDPFGPSTAVSVAFNAHLDKNKLIKTPFYGIEVENFDYIKGVYVENGTDDNTPELNHIRKGYYTGYHNVDFGTNLAKSIEVRVTPTNYRNSRIEIRLDGPEGELLGTLYVPSSGDEWQTVSQEITPVNGMQNIYLVYNGVENYDLFKLNYFRFTTDSYLYPDVTNNGGEITSSLTPVNGSYLNHLIDDRLNTKFQGTTDSGEAWIQYKSPAPIQLKGYALGTADDAPGKDPKSWKLQASANGIDWVEVDTQTSQKFADRYQLKSYDVNVTESYRWFRLLITELSGSANELQLSEWQLHGGCLIENDITADGGILTAQYSGDQSGGIYTNLTDKNITTKYQVNGESDLWVEYKGNALYELHAYSLTSSADDSADPKDWTLYGSVDGKSWSEIDKQVNQKFLYRNTTYVYNCNPKEGYQYFRLHITNNNGGTSTQIVEWQLYGKYYYDAFYNDIITNGGELSSSQESTINSTALKALTDKDGNTAYTLNAGELPVWIQYKSSMPIQLRAYSITASDEEGKDPQAWALQGSNDGETWTTINTRSNISFSLRGERKPYTVSHDAQYTWFRLNITRISGSGANEVKIAEWELHGTGITDKDITANGGEITSSSAGASRNEGVEKLIDKSETGKYFTDFSTSVSIDYVSPESVKVISYSITSANDNEERDPKAWILEASTNGNNWELIDSRGNQTFPYRYTTHYYGCNDAEKEYTHFRLTITQNHGANELQFAEWQLLTTAVDDPVEIPEITEEPLSVEIYPNPVDDYLNIHMPESGTIQIYDVSGQLLKIEQLYEGYSGVYVGDLNNGIYIIRICFENEILSKRIIKK